MWIYCFNLKRNGKFVGVHWYRYFPTEGCGFVRERKISRERQIKGFNFFPNIGVPVLHR